MFVDQSKAAKAAKAASRTMTSAASNWESWQKIQGYLGAKRWNLSSFHIFLSIYLSIFP
jgi:hypothetical protein